MTCGRRGVSEGACGGWGERACGGTRHRGGAPRRPRGRRWHGLGTAERRAVAAAARPDPGARWDSRSVPAGVLERFRSSTWRVGRALDSWFACATPAQPGAPAHRRRAAKHALSRALPCGAALRPPRCTPASCSCLRGDVGRRRSLPARRSEMQREMRDEHTSLRPPYVVSVRCCCGRLWRAALRRRRGTRLHAPSAARRRRAAA